jgi:hypothetical protein
MDDSANLRSGTMIKNVLVSEIDPFSSEEENDKQSYGYYDFSVLPNVGDTIIIYQYCGLAIFYVEKVVHWPVKSIPETVVDELKKVEGANVIITVKHVRSVL